MEAAPTEREELSRRVAGRLFWSGVIANGVGATGLILFLAFLAPSTLSEAEIERILDGALQFFGIYLPIALALGWYLIAKRPFDPIANWLRSGRESTREIQRAILLYPRNWALKSTIPWFLGGIATFGFVADVDAAIAATAAFGSWIGGLTACSLQYLVVERIVRPVTALALAGGPPPERAMPGVGARTAMAWLFGSGVPLLGVASMAAGEVAGADFSSGDLSGATLVVALVGLGVGSVASLIAARSVVDPLGSMRGALEQVERGELDTEVEVDDGSEVGLLEAGFNRMTRGLLERERLRDAFGAFVDPDLAERVATEGTDFAGEEVELSLLFLDVRGFTTFSERVGPQEVVTCLNQLYDRVVPVILEQGGHANKFIGDGLLAVFGAPAKLPDHADRAVAAALEIGVLNESEYFSGLRVGVGVNSGNVVVGTIGGGGRLDFTVIGDPVNTAARVESATRQTGDDVLITAATKELLCREHCEWVERDTVPLRGKSEAVRLFAPAR